MTYTKSIDHEENPETSSIFQHFVWLVKGFVYPIWSFPYYKKASQKPLGTALGFLLVFAILQSIVSTGSIALSLNRFSREIEEAYLSGEIPDIVIEEGIASVSGSGRYINENNRQIIAVDVTGAMREINTNQYSEGFLLTREEFHMVNEDGYQVIPLSDVNKTFGSPIIMNAESMTGLWARLSILINILVLGGSLMFFSLGRFIYLVLLGLIVWGVVSISHKGFDFARILIIGVYANVPTTYLMFFIRKLLP